MVVVVQDREDGGRNKVIMEESLSAKSARLDDKMSALMRQARVAEENYRDKKKQAPPPPAYSPKQRVRRWPAKDEDSLYRDISRRQASLKERAETIARIETELEERLKRLEDEELALAGDDSGDEGLSNETLRAARMMLTSRNLAALPGPRRTLKSKLDDAWLAALKSQLYRLPPPPDSSNLQGRRRRRISCWSSADQATYTNEPPPPNETNSANAVLVVATSSFQDFDPVFDSIADGGGEVCSATDGCVVALFFQENSDDEDLPVANAALAGLSCVGRCPVSARVCCGGSARVLEMRLAHDEVKMVVVGEAVDRGKDRSAPAKVGRVAVDYGSARVLVARGWPDKAFSIADEQKKWLWLAVAKPLPTKKNAREQYLPLRCRTTTTSLATEFSAETLCRCQGTVHRPVPWLVVGGHQRQRPASILTALCSGGSEERAERYAAALNSVTRAFGGITCLVQVGDNNGLSYTSIFFGEEDDTSRRRKRSHCHLAASAALAAVVACPTVVGVSTGTVDVAVVGSRRLSEVVAASSATERSNRLAGAADRSCRVVLDVETMSRLDPTFSLELSRLSFSAGRPEGEKRLLVAASASTDKKWRASAALIDTSRTDGNKIELKFAEIFAEVPSRIDRRQSSTYGLVASEAVPETFQDIVVHNLVPGGRKRRAVTRDVASSALAAFRETFRALWPERMPRQTEEEDGRSSLIEFVESAWNAPPMTPGAFAALAPILVPSSVSQLDDEEEDDGDLALDAIWIRSSGIPARATSLAATRSTLAHLSRWQADYVRGSRLPQFASRALSAICDSLPESAQLLFRAAVVGAGSGGLETLRACTLAVAPLREAFAACGEDDDFDAHFDATIRDLCTRGLLVVEGNGDDASYRVLDGLLADAVYSTTPGPRRKAVHAAHAASLRASLDAQRLDDDLDILKLAHHALLAREPDLAFAAVAEIAARGGRDYVTAIAAKQATPYQLPFMSRDDNVPFSYERARALLSCLPELRACTLAVTTASVASLVLTAAAKLLAPVLLLRRRRESL